METKYFFVNFLGGKIELLFTFDFQVDKLENEAFLEIDKLKNITGEVQNIMFALTGRK